MAFSKQQSLLHLGDIHCKVWVIIFTLYFSPVVILSSDLPNYIDQVPEEVMIQHGDIYIGHLSWNFPFSPEGLCGDKIATSALAQLNIAAVYGLDLVNKDQSLLPNITLGMITLDTCGKGVTSIGQAMKFLPRNSEVKMPPLTPFSSMYDVVGVIGPYRSQVCVDVAGLLNLFQVAMLSPLASSDDLRDRSRYGNFFRLVAPDSFQTKAMVDMLIFFNWTYISVVYEESNYGFNGLIHMRRYTNEAGICIADAHAIAADAKDEDYDFVVSKLVKNRKARVVVIFIIFYQAAELLKACERRRTQGMFIFIFSDGVQESALIPFGKSIAGSFNVVFHSYGHGGYRDFLENTTPSKIPEDPWLPNLWATAFECAINDALDKKSNCSKKVFGNIPDYGFFKSAATGTLAAKMFALAIEAIIRDFCPGAFSNKELLKGCVTQPLVIEYLKKVVLNTEDGPIPFDANGALVQGYTVSQIFHDTPSKNTAFRKVGKWTQGKLEIALDDLQWYPTGGPMMGNDDIDLAPESVCAKPCKPGEFQVQGELKCCWDCFKCRDNEYVTRNGTACSACEYLSWPDQDTFLTCIDIEPSYLWWDDNYGIGLAALAGVGTLTTFTIGITMAKNKNKKVIKGSSPNMMAVIIAGLLMIFTTVLLFIARPTYYLCLASRIGFSLSCTMVFSPLLIKTNRLYQVFRASSKFAKVGPTAKAGVSAVLVALIIIIEV